MPSSISSILWASPILFNLALATPVLHSCGAAQGANFGLFPTDLAALGTAVLEDKLPNFSFGSAGVLVEASHVVRVDSGDVTFNPLTICLENDFLFDNTHVVSSELSAAIDLIVNECCPVDGPTCNGGRVQVNGDTGLEIDISVVPTSDSCETSS